MSIVVSDLSFHYPNQHPLFEGISFSVPNGKKVSIVGNNGTGKSTLLRLMADRIQPAQGSISIAGKLCYIPQELDANITIAEALSIERELAALTAIDNGSAEQSDYDILSDNWDIESRALSALDHWGLRHVEWNEPLTSLSGGEKVKLYLAKLLIHRPDIILMDEPTNHLDANSRELLYGFVKSCKATIVVVSHDITLLNLLETTYELTAKGMQQYGGNYDLYKEQKMVEVAALSDKIHAEQKHLKLAQKQAQEVKLRQTKRAQNGERNKMQLIPIMRKAKLNSGEQTGAKLNEKHAKIIEDSKEKIDDLRSKQLADVRLKIDFEDSELHQGKLLVAMSAVNYCYGKDKELWDKPIDIELYSGDRLHVKGDNGSGKTTFVRLLTGELQPTKGTVSRSLFSFVYLDQTYSCVNEDCSVLELAEKHNTEHLADHEVKVRLNRALFPVDTWTKNCKTLSGGEKMRLYLCCLMLSNRVPDVFILDEPTNNLDVSSLEILSQTIEGYRGTIVLISHDVYFAERVRVNRSVVL